MSPFGIESLPADVVKALQALPQVVDRLDEVASATSEMAAMREGIDSLGEDTGTLSGISEDVRRIATSLEKLPAIQAGVEGVREDTTDVNEKIGVVADATNVLPRMDKRMATIEDAMPTLVEVQQHLSKLPETIETLGTSIDRMATLIDRLLVSMDRLDGNVGALQASIEPLSRVADKLPGSSPKR